MCSSADACLSTFAPMTRRSFVRGVGLALVSSFTKVAASFFDWLTRMFSIDGDLRFAG